MTTSMHRNSRSHKLLKFALVSGGVLFVSVVAPSSGAQILVALLKEYFRKKRFRKEMFLRDLKRLQMRKLADYKELTGGKVKITLTKAGNQKVLEYDLDNLHLNKTKKWDRVWRMVIFDIPHFKRNARNAFGQKLIQLGFYRIQKSVFITPYECEDEIDFICSVFDIRNYVLIFYIKTFEGEEKFRHHFRI